MKRFILFCLFFMVVISGCSSEKTQGNGKQGTITLGAYTVPKEVYQKEIIPAFQAYWKQKTGEDIRFEESYIASGAQSRAIAGGFEADIAALSLEQDVERLRESSLITHDWKDNPYKGFVTRSVIVIAYRPDNPKKIKDWIDLTRDDISSTSSGLTKRQFTTVAEIPCALKMLPASRASPTDLPIARMRTSSPFSSMCPFPRGNGLITSSRGMPVADPRGYRKAIGPSCSMAVASMCCSSFSSAGAMMTILGRHLRYDKSNSP